MTILWNFPQNKFDFQNKQSLNLILSLFANKSEGSLLDCLKSLNYASDIETDDVTSIATAFKCISLEIYLTDTGLINYKKVLALVFEFKKKIEQEWLADGKPLDVWQEEMTVSKLKYQVYTARPADEHVSEIADAMLWCNDVSKVIKKTQEYTVIDEIDITDIRDILNSLTW